MALALALVLAACDAGSGADASPLDDLHLVGIDFELNSMVIENTGAEEVRTEGLWAYRDGESFQFDIFIIEPRAAILFSMRDLGDISTATGEVALSTSDTFTDSDSMLEYVAWGEDQLTLLPTATEAGLWPAGDTVEATPDTIALIRTDPTATGPQAWEASDEVP